MPPHMRPMTQSKEKTDFKSLKKIIVYCKRYLPAILIALGFAVVGAITTIIGPEKIEELTDLILNGLKSVTGIDMSVFVRICIVLLTLYLVGAIANYTQQFIMATITQKISKSLRTDINRKINHLPLKFFDTTTRGDILSRVTNDVDTISQTLGSSIANLVSAIVLFVGVIYKMFVTNPILALVTIASSLLGFVIMFIILGKSQKFFNRRQKNLGDMNGHIEEIYTNHYVMKSYNAEENAKEKFQSINQQLYQNNWKSQFLSGLMQPIMGFIGNLSYALIFIVGVALILGGSNAVTFGTIMSFTIYARLFSNPLTTFAQSMTSIQQASAASKRVFEMLESEELENEDNKNIVLDQVEGNVTFNHVQFGYSKEHMIIHNFSAHLKKGQKVAIVGPTGAGKTTIVNLLMRFYELNAGSIEIDGISIKDMKRETVHDLFDMILQDTWLFKGTIRENLVYNKEQVSDERLDEVCEAVGLKHFIHTLAQGYDTMIDDTISLSEGQKQQLTIARAMIKDAPLLILDEATSSVDTRTEQVIQNAMDNLTRGRTSFVIAHRLSTIKNADVILVMKNGDIIEQGTHQSLLQQNGFYAELYNSQFEPII
ncbi:MAG: ABC transporter ATP-binding protein/permease [Prevotella sp.]|nr:ABC transporter ATP-binding protein/permease [Staphylococcus sp.]MCM1350155.1 ABC transporter ATP-binding protein/permease [Prevotella sp.]